MTKFHEKLNRSRVHVRAKIQHLTTIQAKTSYKYLCPATKGNELVLNLKESNEKMIYFVSNEQDNFDCLTSDVSKHTCFSAERALRTLGIYPSVFSA